MKELDDIRRALNALYLEVDSSIADDVKRRFENYVKAVEEKEKENGR